jgi:hypothetical protein
MFTTITGELSLLMLIEAYELADIHVISANTDGVTIKVHNDKVEKMYEINKWWMDLTSYELERTDYSKIIKVVNCCKRVIILSQILHLYSLEKNIKMGKNLYIVVEPEEIVVYETISFSEEIPAYRILELGRLCDIDSDNYLSLFQLKREKLDIRDAYLNNWLYYTLDTPFWREKIRENNGIINDKDKIVYFAIITKIVKSSPVFSYINYLSLKLICPHMT